ncbi:DNA polymerase III alpha subunit [Bradyrhizobium sp. GM6.1]
MVLTVRSGPRQNCRGLPRRATCSVPVSSLVEIADADAMKESLGLARRGANDRELEEPEVAIRPMTAGGEVVEDYRHVGLTLSRHPVEFLRADLAARRIVTCADAMAARDGRWLEAAGLVLVRQRPGSPRA